LHESSDEDMQQALKNEYSWWKSDLWEYHAGDSLLERMKWHNAILSLYSYGVCSEQ
jgi:hypothetical protein